MTSRQLKARLARLAQQIPEPAAARPVCRFHGTACGLGATWPLPYPEDDNGVQWLIDLVHAAAVERGEDVGPSHRELWARDDHERVPQAELDQDTADLEALIDQMKADNEEIIRRLQAGAPGTSVYALRKEREDREAFARIVEEEYP